MCNVHSARAMHVHYATHHQMQCTIELRTLNFISVPNLVSLAQKFPRTGESLSNKVFFGPGACTLHPTRTATGKAYRLGQYTVNCKFGTGGAHRLACSGGKRRKGTKHLHVRCTCTVHSSPLNRTAPSTLCQGLPTYRVWCLWLKISLHRRTPRQKNFRPWRVLPAPHMNGNHKSTHVEAVYV